MTKTGLYLQDPKYQVRLGGKADFIRDPSLVFDAPLYKLDGASFMSKDAYGHLCTVTGALWTPRARDFDGVDDEIIAPDHPALDIDTSATGGLTLEAFIKRGETDSHGSTINKGRNYGLAVSTANRIYFGFYDGAWREYEGSVNIDTTSWHQIAVVFVDASKVNFYIDGVLDIARDTTFTSSPVTNALTIGGTDFKGLYGEARVYNRALTPLEIQHNYLATKWRYR